MAYDKKASNDRNEFTFHGRLTADPIIKETSAGKVCTFSVANNIGKKVNYFPCSAWKNQAEFVHKVFKKGQKVEVIGSVALNKGQNNITYININVRGIYPMGETTMKADNKQLDNYSNGNYYGSNDGFTVDVNIDKDDMPF